MENNINIPDRTDKEKIEITKAYLDTIRAHSTRIRRRREQLTELRTLAESTAAPPTDCERVQGSGYATSRLENAMTRYLDLEQEITSRIMDFHEARNEIITKIEQLHKPQEIDVLSLRYVDLYSWQDVLDKMDELYEISDRQILRIHRSALLNLYPLIENQGGREE